MLEMRTFLFLAAVGALLAGCAGGTDYLATTPTSTSVVEVPVVKTCYNNGWNCYLSYPPYAYGYGRSGGYRFSIWHNARRKETGVFMQQW